MGSVAGKVDAAKDVENGSHGTPATSHPENQYCRNAYHAGSWYDDDPDQLRSTLEKFLRNVQVKQPHERNDTTGMLRAVICPHAGYSYSGPTAAYSYHAILQEMTISRPVASVSTFITQILVLHPSHHVHLRGQCAITGAHTIVTPIGNLMVDNNVRNELLKLSLRSDQKMYKFSVMTQSQDEQEHSGEMQYPFLAYVLQKMRQEALNNSIPVHNVTVTPIMCGSLSTADEIAYGSLLADVVHRPNVLTIVSTDFCHWGRRFGYQPIANNSISTAATLHPQPSLSATNVPIYEFIEQLDRRGMTIIEAQQPGAFATYLCETGNTVCGRHAIGVWLRAITTPATTPQAQLTVRFIKYEQSSNARSMSDSSVSYAAGVAMLSGNDTHVE
jgi:MEMO1 family protein